MADAGIWSGFLLSAAFAVALFRIRAARMAILRWPQTRGCVEPESVVFHPAGWLPGRARGFCVAAVAFEYEVQGKKYNGCAVVPMGWTILADERERVRGEWARCATVLYNPELPTEAYLDVPDRFHRGSISWLTVKLIVAVGLSLMLGIAILADLN